jgi:glycosyltransferase involved in cell wall biosynthesis
MAGLKILFYYPSNKRTNALETQIFMLRDLGHEVMVLTTCPPGDFHEYLTENGFTVHSNEVKSKGILYYIKQVRFLIKFCKKNRIEVVFSHLQHTNLIAVYTQSLVKSRVIVFRHHLNIVSNEQSRNSLNKNERKADKIINRKAKIIVVPSESMRQAIISTEKANASKIKVIPYIYDFSKYNKPSELEVNIIKDKYPCRLRLIMVSRLVKLKRHNLVFEVVKDLCNQGMDIKLLVMDEGPEKENLQKYVSQNNLQHVISFLGFRTNIMDYMCASDLLIQPSLTDASNSAAKEMAINSRTIVVTSGVGDYDEYVKDNVNGFLLPVNNPKEKLTSVIRFVYQNPDALVSMGKNLRVVVLQKFGDFENARKLYKKLLE